MDIRDGRYETAHAGQVLGGRYRLTAPLGSGGMAVVWQAHDDVLGRAVAVKLVAPALAGDAESRERIRREARAAAALSHPNVAQVYDYGEVDDAAGGVLPFVVMELVPGGTLYQRLSAGPLAPRFVMRTGAEIAAGLAAAHTEGLVHRDIKPGNVMLAPTGAKVVDFGIAAAVSPGRPDVTGEVLGTPAYLAPERLAADATLPASDVYALGVVLHLMFSGRSPWSSENTRQMLNAHLYVAPAPLPPVAGVPDEVARLCDRCLAKEPGERPSARELAAVLAHAAGMRIVTDEAHPSAAAISEPTVLVRALRGPAAASGPSFRPAVPPGGPGLAVPGAGPGSAVPAGGPGSAVPVPDVDRAFGFPVPAAGPVTPVEPVIAAPDLGEVPRTREMLERIGPAVARERRPLGWWVAGAALLAAVGAGGWMLVEDGPDSAGARAQPVTGSSAQSPAPSSSRAAGAPVEARSSGAPRRTSAAPGRTSGPVVTKGTVPVTSAAAVTSAAGVTSAARTTAATTPAPAAPVDRTLTSAAGTVVATCRAAGTAQLLSWSATKPYKVQSVSAGPARAPAVTFKHGGDVVTMTVSCVDGVPSVT